MTPLKSVIGLKQSQQVGGISTEHPSAHVSRILFSTMSGEMLDFAVLKVDILGNETAGQSGKRRLIPVPPLLVVQAKTTLAQLYTQMVEASEHMARVADGKTIGIVTMENLIESLLGVSINDEDDEQRRDHQDDQETRTGAIWPFQGCRPRQRGSPTAATCINLPYFYSLAEW